MGRLAGPLSKQSIAKSWQREVEERRQMKKYERPQPMVVVPPARKRHLALLWAIGEVFKDGLVVGRKETSPYTRDMRTLVESGHLRLFRRYSLGLGFNVLETTEKGREEIASTQPDSDALKYIANAFRSASLR